MSGFVVTVVGPDVATILINVANLGIDYAPGHVKGRPAMGILDNNISLLVFGP